MKKLIILTLSLLIFIAITLPVYAADAPPSLNLGSLLGDSSSGDSSPPSADLSGLGDSADNSQDPDAQNDAELPSLSRVSASPKLFNPLVQELIIKYTLSGNAKIDVEIFNLSGQLVTKLTNNQSLGAGEHTAKWKGTVNNQITGDIVPPARYKYKITVKNANTGEVITTQDAIITVAYDQAGSGTSGTGSDTNNSNDISSTTQANASLALQNITSGRTADTGPGILLYGLFPLAGYFVRKKIKSS